MLHRRFELENNVWNMNRCAGCGMCVAACSRGRLQFEPGIQHPTFKSKIKNVGLSVIEVDTCSFCDGMCAESCPRLTEWQKNEYLSIVSAKTTRKTNFNPINEIIFDILGMGLINELIDSILIMDTNRWDGKPYARIVQSIDELYRVSGNQGLWTPILSHLYKEKLEKGFKKIAIVGPPCVAQAIRSCSNSRIEGLSILRNVIALSIGTFCLGCYETTLLDDLMNKLRVSPSEILSIRRSPNNTHIEVKLSTGNVESIPIQDEQQFIREGCARCTDYLGENADISIGHAGSQEGYSTLIAWNLKGRNFINNCINSGLIEIIDKVDQKTVNAICFDKERRSQTQTYDSLFIYSLESLTDENRLAEIKTRFKDLFTPQRNNSKFKSRGGCIECNSC
ncbi:MAG: Coenzyme F420 hydrogenase/dehydrogenase, beta subunit C-terminal domain [Promethearchaeota archaeon]